MNCFVKAYNFQDYDGYFVQQYLHQNGVVPEVIMGGGGGCQDPIVEYLRLNSSTLSVSYPCDSKIFPKPLV